MVVSCVLPKIARTLLMMKVEAFTGHMMGSFFWYGDCLVMMVIFLLTEYDTDGVTMMEILIPMWDFLTISKETKIAHI